MLLPVLASNGRASDADDFKRDIVLFIEHAMQADGYLVGEVDGICDETLADSIDVVFKEENHVMEGFSGCDRLSAIHFLMAKRVNPDIAIGAGLRVLTMEDVTQIEATCSTSYGMPRYLGHPLAGLAGILRATKSTLIEDMQSGNWRWSNTGELATDEQRESFPRTINCWINNLVRLWKASRQ